MLSKTCLTLLMMFSGWLPESRRIPYCNALSRTQAEQHRAPRNTTPSVEALLSQATADQKKQTDDFAAPSHQPQQGLVQWQRSSHPFQRRVQ